MTPTPTGSIVRTIRVTEVETLDGGAEVKRTISGRGVIVHIRPDVEGMKPSDVRRSFTRTAKQLGVILDVCEASHGHYSAKGKVIADSLPSAFQCVGTVEALGELVKHVAVERWHFALNVRPPRGAQGSGPEKVRPMPKSAFGRPEQLKATARTLAEAMAKQVRLLNRTV
ncbi:MAG: hypothetical protein C0467_16010 [Planctomycetaceae bacterium]|nr:hypothetical protein [Planctomycetaceae bacterium]